MKLKFSQKKTTLPRETEIPRCLPHTRCVFHTPMHAITRNKCHEKIIGHSYKTYREESLSHVGFHVVVVQCHDFDKALQGSHSHLYVRRLRRLTHNLHYVVPLRLQCIVPIRERSSAEVTNQREDESPLTSLSKFALVNSKELRSAVVAASLTWLLGSLERIP